MDKLHWWCDRAWLYAVYLEGVIMLCTLPVALVSWSAPKVIECLLVIFLAIHVFEENTWPAGFFYQNNLGVGSKEPMVYPQNMLTNMITNLGLLTLLSVFVFTGIVPDAMFVTLAANAVSVDAVTAGIVLFACLAGCFIGIPLGISARVKSRHFAFTRKGYYERFD